uniref:Haloacid dehalogenase-like hydrolase domain-containing protein 3 n=1 Tax=Amphora coffeiformis TaxID=265554 RepID=A0A7S3LFS4_9STRA
MLSTTSIFSKHIGRPLALQQQPLPRSIQRRSMGMWPKVRPKRVRVITCDVTGTLVSFRGTLEEHYLGSARKCGVDISPDVPIGKAFNKAYEEVCGLHPCFGGSNISGKDWWKLCVSKSFEYAGVDSMSEEQKERVFQRIFSAFGSLKAYEKFGDTLPFLHFAARHNIVMGVLSNADERYRDSILPMLGVTDDELHFQCFSKDVSIEKPDPRFFAEAMKAAEPHLKDPSDPLKPSHCLHIGNDYAKDFSGARRAGWHAILLNRYGEQEKAAEWKRRGATTLDDLMDVVLWLGQSGCKLG